ncbi:MAG: hypothetical protein IKN29_05445 [Bacteroidales bacterium]|nr:hypothetical protein [Bacteroidales bacterium]
MLLDGANSTWVSGDQIRLNGTTATVTRHDDRAYISSDGLATAGGGETNRSVTMLFDMGYTLANNESVRVMIRSS